ncbi:RNA polymerase sigma factor [Ramlibacter sp. USB13]|uniref:RNA polymerase sigma factor n=1 Tax=Ramlibacter cellulosilyticus TaxID=2764187 RepID=A0A923SB42_9BURK|nr:RNA polymerase sigma factor [Ramlibacter cellulosilyticus]MBC5783461.1 RNA polymerase sigma factor [Ramlibacter cellulosilyticus]
MSAVAKHVATDEDLLPRLRERDAAAFELLMRRHNRRLYRVARSMLGDTAEAEDAVQEAYLSGFRSLAEFRGDASLATWLSRIVVNECMTRLRRQARRDNIVPIVASDAWTTEDGELPQEDATAARVEPPDRLLWRAEMRALLERRIDQLPGPYRVVFVMRAVEELSVEETAQALGIAEATVRTRLFRARSFLREAIAQDLDMAQGDVFDFDGERCDRIVARVLQGLSLPAS